MADEALDHTFSGWLARTDENQKLALVGLAFALALGPLGQGLLAAFGVLFDKAAVPNTQQIEATWWLVPLWCCRCFLSRLSSSQTDGVGGRRITQGGALCVEALRSQLLRPPAPELDLHEDVVTVGLEGVEGEEGEAAVGDLLLVNDL